tara:strand:- start:22074 stop:22589 length:516 start_codon:yes stop_codon:yes gene_type:complete
MAITGTKIKSSSNGSRKYFINKCYIVGAEQIESQYNDTTVKLELEDCERGYKYTTFINQNYVKDMNDVVTELAYPDLVNSLFLAAGKDLNVSDTGDINLEDLANAEVLSLSYPCTGKYKRAIWSKLGKVGSDTELGKEFEDQLAKGYPKNYRKEDAAQSAPDPVDPDDLPF